MTTTDAVMTVTGPRALQGTILPAEHLHADLLAASGHTAKLIETPLTIELLGEVALGAPHRENMLLTDTELAIAELGAFTALGGGVVVDATPPDLSRDPRALVAITEGTGLGIVMGCGRHLPRDHETDAGALAAEMVADLTLGVDGIRAGVIGRIGALDLSHAADRVLFSAVGTAAARTGAPVLIEHPGPAQIDAVLDALLASGVAPERVAVTGCGAVAPDPAAVLALADSGIFVLFDRIARLTDVYRTWDDEDVAAAIVALSTAGRAQQVLLSPGIRERIDLRRYGGGGYGVLGEYGAYLSWHGVDAELLTRVTTDNPRRFLTGALT